MRQQIFEEKLLRLQKAYREYHAAAMEARRAWITGSDPKEHADAMANHMTARATLMKTLREELTDDLR